MPNRDESSIYIYQVQNSTYSCSFSELETNCLSCFFDNEKMYVFICLFVGDEMRAVFCEDFKKDIASAQEQVLDSNQMLIHKK